LTAATLPKVRQQIAWSSISPSIATMDSVDENRLGGKSSSKNKVDAVQPCAERCNICTMIPIKVTSYPNVGVRNPENRT
jgi:hypothetical protein